VVGISVLAANRHKRSAAIASPRGTNSTTAFVKLVVVPGARPDSILQIHRTTEPIPCAARLERNSRACGGVADRGTGTLTFRPDAGDQGIAIVASNVRIVLEGDAAAVAPGTYFSPCRSTVTGLVGDLKVTAGKERHIVGDRRSHFVLLPEISVVSVRTSLSPEGPGYRQFPVHKVCAIDGRQPHSAQLRKIALAAGVGGPVRVVLKRLSSHHDAESPDRP
jgi:hypothetical protein